MAILLETNLDQHEDELRLVRLAQRDPAAFAPLYERYADRIYAYCARRTENTQEAEDLTSQVFVQAIKGLHTFNAVENGVFSAWLFTIARNTVLQYYRRQRKELPLSFDLQHEADDFAEDLDDPHDFHILNQLVHDLPEDKRTLLTLVLDTDLTSAEVGRITNRSATAVRVEFHRIVKALRRRYDQLTNGNANGENAKKGGAR